MQGRVALVTGSATGLGRAVALALAEAGCDVAVNYVHSEAQAEALARAVADLGRRAACLRADVADAAAAEGLVAAVEEQLGRLDVLVHAAGPFLFDRRRLAELTAEEWRRLLDGNLSSAFHLVRRALPGMRARHWGRIVLFGFSEAGQAPGWPGRAAYAAAKVGLVSLARSLALEEARHGITVNVVCPGDIRHPWKERRIAEARGAADERTPVGRPGTGEDVARVVRFLCEEDSDFLTGNVIEVTGGLSPLRRSGFERRT
ncbi:MAG: SDR family oxidoreductase [Firmicutes bacterium]|nr:SDR family oxidoreductase [Bacillota bacterium]MBE3590878.1 SDR family oxidoreductase [Bacillota bacterium]